MINPLVSLCSRRLNGGAGSRIVCINRAGLISLWLLLLSLGASIQPAQASSPASGPVNYETITFLNTDGHSYTRYTTTRSDQTSYQVFFDKTANLDDYVYINPNEYEYSESDPKANVLSFAQGNYALISVGDYVNHDHPERSLVTQDSDGTFTLSSWDGKKQSNGHYGFWNSPANFSSFAIA